MAGVRLRHGRARLGASHLHDDERLAPAYCVVGREHEGPAVLEALDVGGDDADLALVGEIAGEVRELKVDLVPGRRPVRHGDAELLALEDRPALVAALGDERDRGPGQVVAELREGVEVRVRPEQVGRALPDQLAQPGLERLTVGAGLGEAGGEDHREAGAAGDHLLEGLHGPAGEDDREVDVAGHVRDRRVAAHAEDGLVHRVHREERGVVRVRPFLDAKGHRRVRLPARLGRADHRDGPRVQEDVEVDVAQAQGATADVIQVGHRLSPGAHALVGGRQDDTGVSNRASSPDATARPVDNVPG